MGLLCKLFGHKFVRVGEDKGICSAHYCTRCGHHSPAIDWEAIARPLMPACKPPMPEHQVLRVMAGDTLVITTDRPIAREQRDMMVTHAKHFIPEGVRVMVLDAGMKISTLRASDDLMAEVKRTNALLKAMSDEGREVVRSIPIIPQPSPGR